MGILLDPKKFKTTEPGPIKDHEDKSKTLLELINRYIIIEETKMRILSNKYAYNLIKFRPVTEAEMFKEDAALVPYAKALTGDSNILLYKMNRADPAVVRSVLEINGFRFTDKHSWNIIWTSGHAKPYLYEGLNEYQKVNHFPGSFEITRKDKLCENIVQRQQKYGKANFNIIPDTYVLPDEFSDFYEHYRELEKISAPNLWILKPNASSRGRGIKLITDTNDVPIDESCVISRYVYNPFLINGLKFDMRIYVVLTSIDPLRIYVYNEGLTRFCTEKYDPNMKENRFSHLTNYSVNKKNEKFISNKRADADDVGQKWSLSALNKYLDKHKVDTEQVWARIYDLIIRTFIACEPSLQQAYKKTAVCRTNCFELFGFDVLLDDELKPWLMEVNLSPSLACESPLDQQVKSNLIADLFTLVGIRQFDRRKDGAFRGRPTQAPMVPSSSIKKRYFMKGKSVDKPGDEEFKASGMYKKISQIPQKYREILVDTLEEYERKRNFIRIYPAKGTDQYDNLFEVTRINHKVIYKFLYGNDLQLTEKDILQCGNVNPSPPNNITSSLVQQPNQKPAGTSLLPTIADARIPSQNCKREKPMLLYSGNDQPALIPRKEIAESSFKKPQKERGEMNSKILITGDDILIEYVDRLTVALKSIKDTTLKPVWAKCIEKFVTHEVWHCEATNRNSSIKLSLYQRLEEKLLEMKERRKRMLKMNSITKTNAEFEIEYTKEQERKHAIIQAFSVAQLEEMLRSSTRNIAYEVVTCLIPTTSPGVLFNIVTWLSTCKRALISSEEYNILDHQSDSPTNASQKGVLSNNIDKNDSENDSLITSMGGKTVHYKGEHSPGKLSIAEGNEFRARNKAHLTPLRNGSNGINDEKVQSLKQTGHMQAPFDFTKPMHSAAKLSKSPAEYSEKRPAMPHRTYKPLGLVDQKIKNEAQNAIDLPEDHSFSQNESNDLTSSNMGVGE